MLDTKDSGKLVVHFCYLDLQPSFLDFVQVQLSSGLHKSLTVTFGDNEW